MLAIAGVGLAAVPASAVSVAPAANMSVIASEGPGNSLDFYYQVVGGTIWFSDRVAVQGTTYSAPAVVQIGTQVVIAVEGPDHSLDFYWQTIGVLNFPWHSQVAAGPGTTYSAPSMAQVGDSTVIAAESYNRTLSFYHQTVGTRPWYPELVAGVGSALG